MRKYKFEIKVLASVMQSGDILPNMVVFSCVFDADKQINIDEFSDRLFSFWKGSNIISNEWTYEHKVEKL